jgi:putative transcriptional regulator
VSTVAGRLLVATPLLGDPNFDRTVVLMLEHADQGALGVVLNRPSALPVGEILPAWHPVVGQPDVVFHGGPVGTDAALGLVQLASPSVPLGVRLVRDGLGLTDLDAPVEVVAPGVRTMRVFAGYAGWGEGQLDAEIDEGAWFVVDARPDDAFNGEPEGMWRDVLRRQGPPLALVASFPRDPALN